MVDEGNSLSEVFDIFRVIDENPQFERIMDGIRDYAPDHLPQTMPTVPKDYSLLGILVFNDEKKTQYSVIDSAHEYAAFYKRQNDGVGAMLLGGEKERVGKVVSFIDDLNDLDHLAMDFDAKKGQFPYWA